MTYHSLKLYMKTQLSELDSIEQHKVIVLTLFLLVGIFWAPFFTYTNYQTHTNLLLTVTPSIGGFSSIMLIYLLWKNKNVKLISHIYIVLLYSTTTTGASLTGHLNSDVLMLFAVYPILAVFLIGSINGVIISLLAWFGVAFSHYYLAATVAPLEGTVLLPKVAMIFVCYISSTILTMIYEHQSAMLLEKVHHQHNELLQKAKLVAYAEMAKMAAHEINNPLSIAKGNINVILKKAPISCQNEIFTEELANKLGKSDIALDRIASVIRDLKKFEDETVINHS